MPTRIPKQQQNQYMNQLIYYINNPEEDPKWQYFNNLLQKIIHDYGEESLQLMLNNELTREQSNFKYILDMASSIKPEAEKLLLQYGALPQTMLYLSTSSAALIFETIWQKLGDSFNPTLLKADWNEWDQELMALS